MTALAELPVYLARMPIRKVEFIAESEEPQSFKVTLGDRFSPADIVVQVIGGRRPEQLVPMFPVGATCILSLRVQI